MDKRFLDINELADYLGSTKGTIYVWVCHKKIPHLKIRGLLRFDKFEIDNWLKDKRVGVMS